MHIAITARGEDLESEVDPRFGRTSRFFLVDTETMAFEVIENHQSLDLPQRAGIQSAGIKIIVGVEGKVMGAVKVYLQGNIYAPRFLMPGFRVGGREKKKRKIKKEV